MRDVGFLMMMPGIRLFERREETAGCADCQSQIESRHADGEWNKAPPHFASLRTCRNSATASGLLICQMSAPVCAFASERARAARTPGAGAGYALAALATLSAGGLGLAGAGAQPAPVAALTPLGGISPLAPSSLLGTAE